MRALASRPAHKRRSRVLTSLTVAALIGVPILEVWLLIQVGRWIGVLPTIGVLVAEAALGAWLMRREGQRAYAALTGAFATGRMPGRELADAALVLVGGVLLMLPGFATDVIGFVCLLPFTRGLARWLLTALVGRRIDQLGVSSALPYAGGLPGVPGFGPHDVGPQGYGAQGDVISGETVDDSPPDASARRRPDTRAPGIEQGRR